MIIAIGLNKTGTTSFFAALQELNYRPHHAPYKFEKAVINALEQNEKPLQKLSKKYDAFMDIFPPAKTYTHELFAPQNRKELFTLLKETYPDAKFILTTRDIDDWLQSRTKHVRTNKLDPTYTNSWNTVREKYWKHEWEIHHNAAREVFADNPNYLEMNICAGQGYETLCPFLQVQIPAKPFPHRRKTPSLVMRLASIIVKLLRI